MLAVLESPNVATGVLTAQDLADRFGAMPLSRICPDPPPGEATIRDAIRLTETKRGLFELFDGILVSKPMGALESYLAMKLARRIGQIVEDKDLGLLLGEAGMLEILPQQIRIADIAFLSFERLRGSGFPNKAAPTVGPDLAVEILSQSNTKEEMDRKLRDYFEAGARLVWYIDPLKKQVRVFTAPDQVIELGEDDTLRGGDVLPDFELELKTFFQWPSAAP